MQRFRNILVLTDGSSRSRVAVERAATLAQISKARLTALSVLEGLPREWLQLTAAVHPADLWDVVAKERRQRLDRLVAGAWTENAGYPTKVLVGSPFIEVIKEVIRQKHDLVMMVADGEGGVRDVLFGATSTRLMRKCPCPVWVLKSGRRRNYARVLAAVDPAPSDADHTSMNLKIVELASSLARLEGSLLHLVHAWTPETQRIWRLGSRLNDSEVAEIDRAGRDAHSNCFDELIARVPTEDLRMQRHLLKGDAGDLIPRLASRLGIDVIVMGTVCRIGVPGLLIGNTAEKVLRRVSCSVLTVKPEGFVSPVTL